MLKAGPRIRGEKARILSRMECAELEKLRGQVRLIRKEMTDRQERARSMARQKAPGVGKDDYRGLLERKLEHAVADIEQHVARHKCQE